MNHTSPIAILVNQGALTIKADASVVLQFGGMQSFGDIADLELDVAQINPYATYEADYWLLDGNYKLAPTSGAHVGYMSTVMSGTNTNFTAGPEARFYFTVNHSTTGLKLYFSEFSGDWTDSITVTFRNAAESVIRSDTYTPSAATFETNQAVSNFRRIDLIFNSTNKAQRYARLTGIDFDDLTIFSGADVKEARLVEQIDPLANELPINTLDLKLFSAVGAFSIVNPTGIYANLHYKQPLDVYENINNEIIYMGRFYLDTWESLSENLAEFHASDAIGLMEKPTYLSNEYGLWVNGGSGVLSQDLISDIMLVAGISYSLDASLSGITLYGWIPVANCREALQQVCFRLGAYVSCARSSVVQIRPFELASDLSVYDHTITSAQKALGQPRQLRPPITGEKLTSHDYKSNIGGEITVRFNATLATGEHLIVFSGPRQAGTWTGTATVDFISSGVNWQIIDVTAAGTVIFESEGFIDSMLIFYEINPSPPTILNLLEITDATMVNSANAATITQLIYNYYQQRYLQKTKLFGMNISPGDSVLIATQASRQIKGIIERMETDLANGFVSNLEIVGVV